MKTPSLFTLAGLALVLLSPRAALAQAAGSPAEQIAGGAGLDIDVSVTADGKNIAYASSRSGNLEIWMRALDGGALYQMTSSVNRSADRFPVFSPDGKQLVFQSDRLNDTRNIWLMNLANRSLAQLTSYAEGGASHPAISPDGKTICFTRTAANGDLSVWLMSIEGRELREISPGMDCTWTPSGSLVFSHASGGESPSRYDIWMTDANGRGGHGVSALAHTWARSPTVSPDGKWLAYTVYSSVFASDIREVPGGFQVDPNLRTSIWLVSLSQPSAAARRLADDTSFNSYATWTPDSRRLLFTSTRSGSADIWGVNVTP